MPDAAPWRTATMRRLKCSEVWGGIKNQDVDVCSLGLNVSLYSSSCDGGKGRCPPPWRAGQPDQPVGVRADGVSARRIGFARDDGESQRTRRTEGIQGPDGGGRVVLLPRPQAAVSRVAAATSSAPMPAERFSRAFGARLFARRVIAGTSRPSSIRRWSAAISSIASAGASRPTVWTS